MTHPDQPGLWLRRFHPTTAGATTLLCLPHAGGSASFYFPISQAFSPRVRVLAAQYPGRQDRRHEPLLRTITELADGVTAAVREMVAGPLAIFGHSMGAVIGYEVALRLAEAGRPEPLLLFVSGRRAPSRYREEDVHRHDDAQVLAVLRHLGGPHTDALADAELIELFMPAVRGDYQAIETYRHEPGRRISCPIVALIGDGDPLTTVDEARDWRRHTTGPLEVESFAGGHFFLVDHAAEIIELIRHRLGVAAPAGRIG